MTSEIRTTIEPRDIASIELECTACGFRAVWPLAKWRSGSNEKCANCKTSWPMDQFESYQALSEFIGNLKLLAEVTPPVIPFVIRLELAEASQP
jgi:hypothetical protein